MSTARCVETNGVSPQELDRTTYSGPVNAAQSLDQTFPLLAVDLHGV